MNRTLEIEII